MINRGFHTERRLVRRTSPRNSIKLAVAGRHHAGFTFISGVTGNKL